jgi:hypothetical protein
LGDVMLAVPGVEGGENFQRHRAALGMDEGALPVGFGERSPCGEPALMHSGEKREGRFDGAGARVGQFGPEPFFVAFDCGRVFGESEFEADVRVHVVVGVVVDDLACGPAGGAVRSVELCVGEAGDDAAEFGGRGFDGAEPLVTMRGAVGDTPGKAADGIAKSFQVYGHVWEIPLVCDAADAGKFPRWVHERRKNLSRREMELALSKRGAEIANRAAAGMVEWSQLNPI